MYILSVQIVTQQIFLFWWSNYAWVVWPFSKFKFFSIFFTWIIIFFTTLFLFPQSNPTILSHLVCKAYLHFPLVVFDKYQFVPISCEMLYLVFIQNGIIFQYKSILFYIIVVYLCYFNFIYLVYFTALNFSTLFIAVHDIQYLYCSSTPISCAYSFYLRAQQSVQVYPRYFSIPTSLYFYRDSNLVSFYQISYCISKCI